MDRGRREDDRTRDYHEDRGRSDARERRPDRGQREYRDRRGDDGWACGPRSVIMAYYYFVLAIAQPCFIILCIATPLDTPRRLF